MRGDGQFCALVVLIFSVSLSPPIPFKFFRTSASGLVVKVLKKPEVLKYDTGSSILHGLSFAGLLSILNDWHLHTNIKWRKMINNQLSIYHFQNIIQFNRPTVFTRMCLSLFLVSSYDWSLLLDWSTYVDQQYPVIDWDLA